MKKIKGYVAPYMLGMIAAVMTVSTVTANQAQKQNEQYKQKYLNAKKEHIAKLSDSLRYVYYSNDIEDGVVSKAKLTEHLFTNIFDVNSNLSINQFDSGTMVGSLKNARDLKVFEENNNSDFLKQDYSLYSSLAVDEATIRKNQILHSYKKLKKEKFNIYRSMILNKNYEFPETWDFSSKDAWGRNFAYEKIAYNEAKFSFDLPGDPSNVKILTLKMKEIPQKVIISEETESLVLDVLYSAYWLTKSGDVWVTGRNDRGQLGLGHNVDQNTWVKSPISGIRKIVPGANYAETDYGTIYAITTDNEVWATGYGSQGQLGQNNRDDSNTWIKMPLSDIKTIKTEGKYRTYAITNTGDVWVVGNDNAKQFGLGNDSDQLSWAKLPLENIKDIIASTTDDDLGFSFALGEDGRVWATGRNDRGQLGIGNTTNQNSWQLSTIDNVKYITTLTDHYNAFAIKENGELWAVGLNTDLQLGLGVAGHKSTWQKTIVPDVKEINSYGRFSMYAVTNAGDLWVAGANGYGCLGLGDTTRRGLWTQTSLTNIKTVKTSYRSGCAAYALSNDGKVYGAGRNRYGMLNTGDTENVLSWHESSLTGVKDIFLIDYITGVALTDEGDVFVIGYNSTSLGGDDSNSTSWIKTSLSNIKSFHNTDVGGGGISAYAISNTDELYGAHTNIYGQLGLGDTVDKVGWFKSIGSGATEIE